MGATKAPTGVTISRNGGTYTASWKCGDKNYDKGQQFQYRINGGGWISLSVAVKARSKAVGISMANYYPAKNAYFVTLSVRIRGKKKKKKSTWSAWTTKTYTNYVPNVPSLSASLNQQQTNKCTFSWSLSTSATDARPYTHVRYETILVKESNVTDGSKLKWSSGTLGWATGTSTNASGSSTITEDTALLANASYTRWYRVCARGARGSSAWKYAKHVYARPYQAKINDAKVTNVSAGGMTCYANWTAGQSASHPIDYTSVQYVITVPDSGLSCPSGAQWNEANISADTAGDDAVRFSIDNALGKDECLFVRVNTTHDSNTTYSEPFLAAAGFLKDPTDLGYQVDNTNHTLTSVSVDNNSDVPDSFIVLVYRAGSKPEDEIAVGIIPHGASQPLVTPVQCPDWSGETAFSIGAYAAVGTYTANISGYGYTVKTKARSENTIWVGGAVPVAPEQINVVQSVITGTATVTWDWTWEEATYAQLSWTDHDDAWESTDEPEIYTITKPRATKWNISGLDLGKRWYIAVRLVSGNPEDENAIYSPWSDMTDIILSSVPNVPSLNLSARVITEGEEITASWDYVSNDGTGQISADICEVVDTPLGNQYGTYYLSEDTSVLDPDDPELLNGKTYYTKSGYVYTKVETILEDDDPSENGWYEYQETIAHTETQNEVVIDTAALGWAQGEVHNLSVRVTSGSNRTTDWSNPVPVVIAEALDCSISDTSLVEDSEIITVDGNVTVRYFNSLTEMPLTIELSGVNSNITATVTIERTADYHMDRPDGTQFDGYEGEIVYLTTQNTNEEITVNQEDLIGLMDDGAPYRVYATFKDVYGQSMNDSVNFEVHWTHQAIIPEAAVIIDNENLIAKLTPIAPTGTLTGDTCDIYRLSADRPELIVKDAAFGTQYVDPYPAIGEFGGHRFVFKTVNGDYITVDNDIAWTDTSVEEGDILDFDRTIIDFDGNQLLLYYNVDVGHQWDKDFQQTKYLGGSIQGDWNAGVSRSGSVSATMITLTDAEQIRMMRELASYAGICHVRTKDGSSYSADVQVSEDREHDDYDKLVSFSLTITRVDTEILDGLTYEQWAQEEPDEE